MELLIKCEYLLKLQPATYYLNHFMDSIQQYHQYDLKYEKKYYSGLSLNNIFYIQLNCTHFKYHMDICEQKD